MTIFLLTISFIILACVLLNRVTDKVGVPILLAFILLGMAFGTDGIWKIEFDNFSFAEQICSVALIFIMFYGGFGTNWQQAKPVAVQAAVLSTAGVALTAGITGVFCRMVLHMEWLEALLLGALVSSTDAASVFSILRSKNLGLKYNTASLLELESGSNDPCSYMLTAILITVMTGTMTAGKMAWMVFAQFFFATAVSLAVASFAIFMLRRFKFGAAGFDTVFVIAVALLAYALASWIGGNGYLSVYIVGIILGNSRIKNKASLVPFFDGVTSLMQMMVFFLLGLLCFPSRIPQVLGISLAAAAFLTFAARPLVVFLLMAPFGGKWQQKALVSFAGLRGAASIVFAIMAMVGGAYVRTDLFHVVFGIVLLSIAFQGTLIPWFARKLDMIDEELDIRKTFTDYVDEVPVQFVELRIGQTHPWTGKTIAELGMVQDLLIVVILRGRESLIPVGNTVLEAGDRVVISGPAYQERKGIQLVERTIGKRDSWAGRPLAECSRDPQELVVMIRRGDEPVIPRGDTILQAGDVLVIHTREAV